MVHSEGDETPEAFQRAYKTTTTIAGTKKLDFRVGYGQDNDSEELVLPMQGGIIQNTSVIVDYEEGVKGGSGVNSNDNSSEITRTEDKVLEAIV